jgi:hypothetical protein
MIDPFENPNSRNEYLPAVFDAADLDTVQMPKQSYMDVAQSSMDNNRQSTYVKRKPVSTVR